MPNTPVRAAAEGLPKITRRKALLGIASVPATGMAIAAPTTDSPILCLYREWLPLYVAAYAFEIYQDEQAMNRACNALWAIEDQAVLLPARTALELAAKVAMCTTLGEFCLESESDRMASLMADVRAVLS